MKQVIDQIAEKLGITKKLAGEVVGNVVEGIVAEVKEAGKVKVKGLGTFAIKEKAARTARNPKTGESVEVPAKTVITFEIEKALQESL